MTTGPRPKHRRIRAGREQLWVSCHCVPGLGPFAQSLLKLLLFFDLLKLLISKIQTAVLSRKEKNGDEEDEEERRERKRKARDFTRGHGSGVIALGRSKRGRWKLWRRSHGRICSPNLEVPVVFCDTGTPKIHQNPASPDNLHPNSLQNSLKTSHQSRIIWNHGKKIKKTSNLRPKMSQIIQISPKKNCRSSESRLFGGGQSRGPRGASPGESGRG